MIAVTATRPSLDSPLDSRFGRCRFFVLVESETDSACETIENSSRQLTGGAGVDAVQFLVERRVSTLLTGRVGPKAKRALDSAGIHVYTGTAATVADLLSDFAAGRLTEGEAVNGNEQ